MRYAVGIDIGGTNTKIGIVDLYTKKVINKKIIPIVNGCKIFVRQGRYL